MRGGPPSHCHLYLLSSTIPRPIRVPASKSPANWPEPPLQTPNRTVAPSSFQLRTTQATDLRIRAPEPSLPPNISPPMAAPDRLCGNASWRASCTCAKPVATRTCVASTADENASNQIDSRIPKTPCAKSSAAARKQNRLCWAHAPNTIPTSNPPAARIWGSE